MSSQMIRDRAGVVDGVSNIPDYLKYKSKRVQTSVFQKRRVKDDILSNANATGGAVIRAKIGSQAFIDPKSLRFGFQFSTAADAPLLKAHDDCGLNGMIRSLKVSSGSKQLENIGNYNLLMKMMYPVSVSNDWKQNAGWTQGFGTVVGTSTTYNGPSLVAVFTTPVVFELPLWSGLLANCERLLPNNLLQLVLDIELAPKTDFLTSTSGADTAYRVNNLFLSYDEYVVSPAYQAVFESALVQGGITFDFSTVSNVNIAHATGSTINAIINDSQKQLKSIYTIVRPNDIGDSKSCTALESIDGSRFTSFQYKIGTVPVPEYRVSTLAEAYDITLDSVNRVNHMRDDYPLTYYKYGNIGRNFWVGVDLEKQRADDNSTYSGIDTNGTNITFNMVISGTTVSNADNGSTALAASVNGAAGFFVDMFLAHDRLLTISSDKSVVLDF